MTRAKGPISAIVGAITLTLSAGCSNKLSGSLDVDGETFRPTSCKSLARMGRTGVEVEAADGERFRFAERADGAGEVFHFARGEKVGKLLGACAELHVEAQSSSVNKVTNVMGKAVVDCEDHSVTGTVTFENCH